MKKLLSLGLASITLALSTAAMAYPTQLGATGGAILPDANIAQVGACELATDFYDTNLDSPVIVRALTGLTPNLEVGAGYNFQNDANAWTVGAKYLTPVTLADFKWALGGAYMDTSDPLMKKVTTAYLVGTRPLTAGDATTPAITGSLGLMWTEYELQPFFGSFSDSAIRPFFAAQAQFGSGLLLSAEYQLKDSAVDTKALSSIAARYPFTKTVTGQVGYSNGMFGAIGGDDYSVFFGANITFDCPR